MNVYFRTRKLETTCSSLKKMRAEYGPKMTKKLALRLEQFRAADCLEDIGHVPGARCHELKGDRAGQLAVDLVHPQRLIFVPADDPISKKKDGGLDWSGVTEIEVIDIGDYH